ncbi:terpene cyclase/mutase family protein [Candidatus Poribacteria bacterium]|nr:terpene cyclase/mutase family protein [Candidatus Poribacteria bacterium]
MKKRYNIIHTFGLIILFVLTLSTCSSTASVTESLAKAADYIKSMQNADGGWPLTQGGKSDVETTAWAIQALLFVGIGSGSETISKGLDYLVKSQGKDGDWNGNSAHTAFSIIALSEAGLSTHETFTIKALGWLRKKAQNIDGSWSKNVGEVGNPAYTGVVLTAMKRVHLDTMYTPVPKALQWLMDNRNSDGGWAIKKGESSNTLATAWVIQGLSIAGIDYAYTIEESLNWLKQVQNDDGGFGMTKGQKSDQELTAYAILALVAGKDTSTAGYRAVHYLRKVQQKDGSYVSTTPTELKEPTANIQTTCFAIWAMVAETISKKK